MLSRESDPRSSGHSRPEILSSVLSDALSHTHQFAWTTALAGRLVEVLSQLQAGRFHLAVLGQFKRGKSTLLNALLGGDFLPSSVLPLTSIPVYIEYAKSSGVELAFSNGKTSQVALSELQQYVTEENNPRNKKGVSNVRVLLPSDFLKNDFVLIDTPGIGSTFLHNTETTQDLIPKCDAAVFLLSIDPPVSETELLFLKKIRSHIGHLLYAVNKIDYTTAEEAERVKTFFQKVICESWELGSPPPVLLVSARLGLDARNNQNQSGWASSGMAALEGEIREIANRIKKAGLSSLLAAKALHIVENFDRRAALALESINMPIETLNQCVKSLEAHFGEMDRKRQEAFDLLEADLKRTLERIEEESRAVKARFGPFLMGWLTSEGIRLAERDEREFQAAVSEKLKTVFGNVSAVFFSNLAEALEMLVSRHEGNLLALLDQINKTANEELSLPAIQSEAVSFKPEKIDIFWETQIWSNSVILLPSAATIDKFLPKSVRRRRLEKRIREEMEHLTIQNIENLRWKAIQEVETVSRRFREAFEARYETLKSETLLLVQGLQRQRMERSEESSAEREKILTVKEKIHGWRKELYSLKEKTQ